MRKPTAAAASDEGQARANESQPWLPDPTRSADATDNASVARGLATPRALAEALAKARATSLHSRRQRQSAARAQAGRSRRQTVAPRAHRSAHHQPRGRTGKSSRLAHRTAPKKRARLPHASCPRRRARVPGAAWLAGARLRPHSGSAARRLARAAPHKPPPARSCVAKQAQLGAVGQHTCAGSAVLLGPVRAGSRELCRGAVARTSVEPERNPSDARGRARHDQRRTRSKPLDGGRRGAGRAISTLGLAPEHATRKHQRVAVRSLFIVVAARSKRAVPPASKTSAPNLAATLPSARPTTRTKSRCRQA